MEIKHPFAKQNQPPKTSSIWEWREYSDLVSCTDVKSFSLFNKNALAIQVVSWFFPVVFDGPFFWAITLYAYDILSWYVLLHFWNCRDAIHTSVSKSDRRMVTTQWSFLITGGNQFGLNTMERNLNSRRLRREPSRN